MEYIHLFNTISECDTYYNGESYKEPCVSFTLENNEIKYNKVATHDYSKDYFTLKAITSGNFGVEKRGYAEDVLKYRINGGEWVIAEGTVSNLPLNEGDAIEVSFNPSHNMEIYGGNFVSFTGQFEIYGNIFSLMYGDDFESYSTMKMTFAGMFQRNQNIISAENLILPATTLIEKSYSSMFDVCSNLEKAPVLPAQTLSANCYKAMFNACPKINYIKCLATDISASECTNSWLYGVSFTGTFVKDATMTSWTSGVNGIPENWTVEDAS